MRSDGFKLCLERFRLDINKNSFRKSGDAVTQLLREVVGSPSLEVFKAHGDVAKRNVGSGHGGEGWRW